MPASNRLVVAVAALALCAPVLCIGAAAAAPPMYTTTDIGNLGAPSIYAYGLNASGWIAGQGYTAGYNNAVAFSHNGSTLSNLGTLGGPFSPSGGQAINASGWIAGWSYNNSGRQVATLYNGTTTVALPDFGGSNGAAANGINDAGAVVGYSWTAGNAANRAFLYNGSTTTSLGILSGGSSSTAYGINNSGQIVGTADNASGNYRAFRWQGGTMTSLGTLGGSLSEGRAINSSGWVTGLSETSSNTTVPFLFNGSTMVSLGSLGGTYGEGVGINSAGWVVGMSTNANSWMGKAFVHDGTAMFDLTSLVVPSDPNYGVVLTGATGINDAGQIVANAGGRVFLLAPVAANNEVPEPATLAVLATGLLGLAAARRRRPA